MRSALAGLVLAGCLLGEAKGAEKTGSFLYQPAYAIDHLLLHAAEGMKAEDGYENRMGVAGHSPPLACLDRARRACRKRALP